MCAVSALAGTRSAARTALGNDAAFARAWQEGAALAVAAAIDLALEDIHPTQ